MHASVDTLVLILAGKLQIPDVLLGSGGGCLITICKDRQGRLHYNVLAKQGEIYFLFQQFELLENEVGISGVYEFSIIGDVHQEVV